MMLNTMLGIIGTIAFIGLLWCFWKWLFTKFRKIQGDIDLKEYKKTCRIILYVSISFLVLLMLVIGLWFGLVYPTLK